MENRKYSRSNGETTNHQFHIWHEFPRFPRFPKPENQGFSTVPDYQSLKIVPIFGSMLYF